jgi:hypothetical protein
MFKYIEEFEQKISKFYNAPYAVATDCCTHAIELCLKHKNYNLITIPTHTYISVPFTFEKLNLKWKFEYKEWKELSRKKRIEGQTKSYKITFNNGDFIIINGLTKFAKENGYSSGIFNVMNGTYKKHKDIVAVEKLDTTS